MQKMTEKEKKRTCEKWNQMTNEVKLFKNCVVQANKCIEMKNLQFIYERTNERGEMKLIPIVIFAYFQRIYYLLMSIYE